MKIDRDQDRINNNDPENNGLLKKGFGKNYELYDDGGYLKAVNSRYAIIRDVENEQQTEEPHIYTYATAGTLQNDRKIKAGNLLKRYRLIIVIIFFVTIIAISAVSATLCVIMKGADATNKTTVQFLMINTSEIGSTESYVTTETYTSTTEYEYEQHMILRGNPKGVPNAKMIHSNCKIFPNLCNLGR
ncbi:unnamed protein product [Owenia fusiformis]|uniref:Uncharacterized protein n=1 Tax=Owenia fusiformis TaxID=6347 RepID=A0A8S4Q5C3_OWEFU|nr:unnamed protein product [Owenia fusiformis]